MPDNFSHSLYPKKLGITGELRLCARSKNKPKFLTDLISFGLINVKLKSLITTTIYAKSLPENTVIVL